MRHTIPTRTRDCKSQWKSFTSMCSVVSVWRSFFISLLFVVSLRWLKWPISTPFVSCLLPLPRSQHQQLLWHVEVHVCHEGRQALYSEFRSPRFNPHRPSENDHGFYYHPVQKKEEMSHDAGQNIPSESNVGYNHAQVSNPEMNERPTENNKIKRRKKQMPYVNFQGLHWLRTLSLVLSCLLLQNNRNLRAKLTLQS